MKSSNDIIDAVAARLGNVTDYKVAKQLEIPTQTISNIRHGRRQLSRQQIKRAALVLGLEPGALIAIVAAEREEDSEIRDSLFRVATRAMAAIAMAGVLFGGSGSYSEAHASSSASPVYYVKSRRRLAKRTWRTPSRRRIPTVANDGKPAVRPARAR